MIINGFKEVIINNGVNFGSFKGEPDGFVKLPVGSLFARQNYKYWKKLPSRPWEPYTDLYYRPTLLEFERDYNGKMWFKSNNGWLFVGEMEKGRAAGSPPTPLPATMSMLFMDNVDFTEYVLNCGDHIEKSEIETDYVVSVSIYNEGEQNLEITSASVVNGDIAYRELNFDGSFPYTVQGGNSVGFEIVTNKNAVTQSFGDDFYNSTIRIQSNTGTCDFYVSSSFYVNQTSPIMGLYYFPSDEGDLTEFDCGDVISSLLTVTSDPYTKRNVLRIINNGDQNLVINNISIDDINTDYVNMNLYDPVSEDWFYLNSFPFPVTIIPGEDNMFVFESLFDEERIVNELGAGERFWTLNINSNATPSTCSFDIGGDFQSFSPGFFYNQTGYEWILPDATGPGQYYDVLGSSYGSLWSLWVATSENTRELVFTTGSNNGTTWDLTEYFNHPVVTDIPGNNKKFFITVQYINSGTQLPVAECPTNINIVSVEGIATVEEYSGMESKFSETGFEWISVRRSSDDELVETINNGQWINIDDVTNCNVTISVDNAAPIIPISTSSFFYVQTGDEWTVPPQGGGQAFNGPESEGSWYLWVATSDTTRELVETFDKEVTTWNLKEYLVNPIVSSAPGDNKRLFITTVRYGSGGNQTEIPTKLSGSILEGAVIEQYHNMEDKFSETGFEWIKCINFPSGETIQTVNYGDWVNIENVGNCQVTVVGLNGLPSLPVPGNDDFDNAFEISEYTACGDTLIITGSNVNSTRQNGEPYPITSEDAEYVSASIHSVWWKWTPDVSLAEQTVTFDLVSSSYDTQIAIYTGSTLETLEKITFDDDFYDDFRSKVQFPFTTGVTYYIQVDGYYGEMGDIDMRMTVACPEAPCAYSLPEGLVEFGDSFLKGFGRTDYNTDAIWNAANTGVSGPSHYSETIMMSDDGRYILIGGPRSGTRKFFVLEKSGSEFITHNINMTGITEIMGVRRQYDFISVSDPRNHQIARNGRMVAGVKTPGIASALWANGFENPPTINSEPNYYNWISDNGEYTLGYAESPNGAIRVDIDSETVEIITGSSYNAQAGNFCMDRIVGWSSIDPDERAALFTRSAEGVWTEEEGILVAHNVDPEVDYPSVYCMSGDGTKACGEDKYGYAKALYWDLSQPPTGGYYQAIVLPNPADSASYGQSGTAEVISSDGTVIAGYTEYGYTCFWSAADNFSTCYLLQTYLVENAYGPQTASMYNGLVYSSGSYNTFGKVQVSAEGKNVIAIGSKQGSGTAEFFFSEAESLIYANPAYILSDPFMPITGSLRSYQDSPALSSATSSIVATASYNAMTDTVMVKYTVTANSSTQIAEAVLFRSNTNVTQSLIESRTAVADGNQTISGTSSYSLSTLQGESYTDKFYILGATRIQGPGGSYNSYTIVSASINLPT